MVMEKYSASQNSYFISPSGAFFPVGKISQKLKKLFSAEAVLFSSTLSYLAVTYKLTPHAPSVLQTWLIISSFFLCVKDSIRADEV